MYLLDTRNLKKYITEIIYLNLLNGYGLIILIIYQMITNFNDLETKVKNFQNNKNEINNDEICVSGNTSKLITQVINNVLQEKD